MMHRMRERLRADDGFGLAELGIYAALSVVVLTICGSIFISTLKVRTQVVELTDAVSIGQLIATSVEEGVRNASGPPGATDATQRLGVKSEPATSFGQLLRARVAVGTDAGTVVWQCQAWFYSIDTRAVYASTNTTGLIDDPVSFSVVGGSHEASAGDDDWTLLGDGITFTEGHPQIFGTSTSGSQAGQANVVLYFEVTKDGTSLVLIPTTVVNRKLEAGGTGPTTCY